MRQGSVFRRCSSGARIEGRRCAKCGGDTFSWAYVVDVSPPGSPNAASGGAAGSGPRRRRRLLSVGSRGNRRGTQHRPARDLTIEAKKGPRHGPA